MALISMLFYGIGCFLISNSLFWLLKGDKRHAVIAEVVVSKSYKGKKNKGDKHGSGYQLTDNKNFDAMGVYPGGVDKYEDKSYVGASVKGAPKSALKKIATFITLLVLAFSSFFIFKKTVLYFKGEKTTAVIVSVAKTRSSEGTTMYKPVYEYIDGKGISRRVKRSYSSSHSKAYTGQQVEFIYDPVKPENYLIGAFWQNIIFESVVVIACILALMLMLRSDDSRNRGGGYHAGSHSSDLGVSRKHSQAYSTSKDRYSPIYEYTDDTGRRQRVKATWRSSSFLMALPGDDITVWTDPDGPSKCRRYIYSFLNAGILSLFVGIIGLLLTDTLPFSLPVNVIASVLFAFVMIRQLYSHKPFRHTSSNVKVNYKNGEYEDDNIGRFDMSEIQDQLGENDNEQAKRYDEKYKNKKAKNRISRQEAIDRLNIQYTGKHVLVIIFFVAALACFIGSIYGFHDQKTFLEFAQNTEGQVFDIIRKRSSSSNGGSKYTYTGRIEFSDFQGRRHKFTDNISRARKASLPYQIGGRVNVLYSSDNPKRAIIDRGYFNFTLSYVLAGLGVIFLLCIVQRIVARQKVKAYIGGASVSSVRR